MVNIINNWLVLFIPLLNWLTPKRYIKISQEELESLNTFKPAKNNAFWPALGSSVLFSVTFVNSGLKMLFYGGLKMSFFSGLRLSYI
ncbi:Putative membrane spanning protein [Staphylococcus aureus]|nr:Putative membrane spanning protein [Staphylococcus aureus]